MTHDLGGGLSLTLHHDPTIRTRKGLLWTVRVWHYKAIVLMVGGTADEIERRLKVFEQACAALRKLKSPVIVEKPTTEKRSAHVSKARHEPII